MDRASFHKLFKTGNCPAVLPVIHVLDYEQTRRNVIVALKEGAQGVFLINHDFYYPQLLPIIKEIRSAFPYLWMGVNFLGTTGNNTGRIYIFIIISTKFNGCFSLAGLHAFPELGQLAKEGTVVDAYWADNACIDEKTSLDDQKLAKQIQDVRKSSGWNGLYFGGTAFKKQRHVAGMQ